MLHAALYILATLLANYTVDWFIPIPLPGLAQPLLISVGTLFFGITFTQRDRVHRRGRRFVYGMIGMAAVLNVLMSIFLGVPWRFILASFLAIVLAEAADTEVYQRFLRRPWLERVLRSNLVSVPLDSTIFTLIAFAGNPDFPASTLLAIILGDVLLKLVIGLLAALWRAEAQPSREHIGAIEA